MKLKLYSLGSTLAFGKFANHTIQEIIDIDFTYIIWCINHLEHFYITDEVIEAISNKYPTFEISELTKKSLETKSDEWEAQTSYYEEHDEPSYGKYAGSFAQEYEGLSDDFIDSALDGCPDAYWNID